jgi:predicted MFS family arabinose efflux permease
LSGCRVGKRGGEYARLDKADLRILLGLDPWHWPPGQVCQIQAESGDLTIPLEPFSIYRDWQPVTIPHQRSEKAILAVIVLARGAVNLGLRIVYPFLPAISRGLGISLSAAGALVAARSLAGMFAPLFGVLADRRGGRWVMLLGSALLVAGAALIAGLPWYAVALLGFGLLGLSKGAYDSAVQAYIGRRVPYEQRGRALGISELAWSAAWLGMPLGGWLIARAGWRAPFVLIALLGALGWWLTQRVLPPDEPEQPGPGASRQERESIQRLLRDRHAWVALSITALFITTQEILFVVYGAWMEDAFGLAVTTLGLASLIIGAAEALGEVGAALLSDRLGKRRAVFAGMLFASGGYLVLPRLTGSLALALAGTALVILAFEFSVVSYIPLVSGLSATARGTLMSFNVVAFSVGRTLAAPLAVALYRPGDLTRNGAVAACVSVLILVLLLQVQERGH